MRTLVVQYAGDYLAAHKLSVERAAETYYGHQYVLQQLSRVNAAYGETAILCCKSPTSYDELLPSGLRVIGAGADKNWAGRRVIERVRAYAPSRLVVLGPMSRFIKYAVSNDIRTLCIFADSFELHPLRRWRRYGRLGLLLRARQVEWVANHGISACLSLKRVGVPGSKIIPWDWPHVRRPQDSLPKDKPPERPVVFFAGAVTDQKGVGDLIAAISILRRRGLDIGARIAGAGDIERFRTLARKLKVGPEVEFLGVIPNGDVVRLMREAAIVAVPSRHSYPEGLPLTIYEGLCARTPIVASDHPMFRLALVHGETAMVHRAGRPDELASAVGELLANPTLYRALSRRSEATWETLQLPVKWGEMVSRWLSDAHADRAWLTEHRLDSGAYGDQLCRFAKDETSKHRRPGPANV